MNASEKICLICGKENEGTVLICLYCGTQFDEKNATGVVSIPENLGEQAINIPAGQAESFIDVALIPEGGLGIHIAGESKPIYVPIYNKELIIGRSAEADEVGSEAMLDLSDLHATSLGISRQHAMIRQTTTGFEVIDLASRNGTWLNAERLVPNKPYPLTSGSQLRIGQMRLLIMYLPPQQK